MYSCKNYKPGRKGGFPRDNSHQIQSYCKSKMLSDVILTDSYLKVCVENRKPDDILEYGRAFDKVLGFAYGTVMRRM